MAGPDQPVSRATYIVRRHRQWLLLPLLAVALFTVSGRVVAQGEMPSIFVDPANQTVYLSDEPVEVRLMVDDVKDPDGLGGYTLVMTYDPAVLHAMEATDTGYAESTGNDVICLSGTVDNIMGRLGLWCFVFGFLPPVLGPQPNAPVAIAVVTFEPVGEGSTELGISGTSITNALGTTLAVSTTNGKVIVQNPPDPTPTATAADIPTATATDTPTATTAPPNTPPPTFTPLATWTPASTWTPQPTWTPDASPTATATPANATGDVNCDRTVNAVDATLILQFGAGLLAVLPCPDLADTNADGIVNPLDAALILQLSAGLLDSLPPVGVAGTVRRESGG